MMESTQALAPKSPLDGLWVLIVQQPSADDGRDELGRRVPVMARAGNDETYLLGFKNMTSARKFMTDSALENAEPRMVVKGNKGEFLKLAQDAGVVGVLVDYDATTQQYRTAAELY
jgi:hypothetical protein